MANFGIRLDLRNPSFSGVAMADRIAAAVDMAEWADRLGGMFVSLPEHHGSEDGYLPSPLTLAGAIAARTSTIRLTMALVTPFYDPQRLAEDLSFLDLLSRGRIDVTLLGGYVPTEFAMFGVAMSERPTRVTEMVECLKAVWKGEPCEYKGRSLVVRPLPFRPGGPPLSLGGTSEAVARRAARIGDSFTPGLPTLWEFYRDECLKVGKKDPGPPRRSTVAVTILSEDPDATWGTLAPYFLHETNAYGAWEATRGGQAMHQQAADVAALRKGGTYRVLTPRQYVEELRAQGAAAFAVLHPMVGGIPPELAWHHLRLFERDVVPHLPGYSAAKSA